MANQNNNFDAILKLLPGILAAYPALSTMLGDKSGESKVDVNQLLTALPQVMQDLQNADEDSMQELMEHITEVLPGLEELLPKGEGEDNG